MSGGLIFRAALILLLCLVAAPAAAALPDLPWGYVDTSLVIPTGAAIWVPNGGDLQHALNVAEPGDVILLEAGGVFHGPFTLPRKTGEGWIAVVSSRVLELEAGQRVLPSDAPKLAVLEGGQPSVLQTEPGAHHYRFVGLEIRPPADTFMFNIVDVGSDARTTDDIPHHVIFDRCYLHGDSGQGARRALAMNGAHIAVIDSYLSDFKEVNNDSQAIVGWSGPGPFKIVNNYLEAAGENLMFGGEDPWLEGLVPSDIEIRNNDIARPWSWWHLHPDYDGRGWTIKNLLELKNARRVLIQGNRFARNWAHGQQGFSIVLTPRNQEGTAPWSRVEDVTFIDNELHDIDSGVNIAAFDDRNPNVTLARVLIRNNLFAGVGMTPGTGRAFQLLGGPPDVTIEDNTVVHGAWPNTFVMFDEQPPAPGLVIRNNILSYGLYGMYGNGVGSGTAALERFAPGAIFDGNVLYGFDPDNLGRIESQYPVGNTYIPDAAAVVFGEGTGYQPVIASP